MDTDISQETLRVVAGSWIAELLRSCQWIASPGLAAAGVPRKGFDLQPRVQFDGPI